MRAELDVAARPTPVTRPARISPGARTNVPQWPTAAAKLPPGARRWILVDLGAPDVAATWAEGNRSTTPLARWPVTPGADDGELRRIADALSAQARVGTRVALCGAEADVMVVRAGLIDGGFLDAEVVAQATSVEEIRVRCVHCGTISRRRARPGDVVPCDQCGYDEVVHHHFSRRLAAYLAFRADAESGQPPAADDDG